MRPRLLIVADDLTGALDSAAPFAARGLATVVARHPGALAALPDADVVAVSTGSRERPVNVALAAVGAVAAAGLRPHRVFKKVDSRLKGHVAAETGSLAAAFGALRILACPAVPLLGRFVANGAVTGAGVHRPIPVAPMFAGLAVDVRDAPDQAALTAIVAEAGDAMLVGAAGLSLALAETLSAAPPRTPAYAVPILFAIGSRDPVTIAQLGALPPGVRLMRQPDAPSGPDAGERFAADVAAEIGVSRPATVLACGGETADAILAALRVDVLVLRGEAVPGVPVADAGAFTLLTKSGGFGAATLLAEIAATAAA